MRKVILALLVIPLLFFISCDALQDVEKCVDQYAEYTSKSFEYSSIESEICSNKKLVESYIEYLKNDANRNLCGGPHRTNRRIIG